MLLKHLFKNGRPALRIVPSIIIAVICASAFIACQKEEIRVYRAPREKPSLADLTPEHWQQLAAGQMQQAKFRVTRDNQTIEITLSIFPGDAGGLLANVNRWRGQIGLNEADPAALPKLAEAFDAAGPGAKIVDMTGTDAKATRPARLIGAIVTRGERTWYYKLLGDPELAEREKPAFLKFAQTAP